MSEPVSVEDFLYQAEIDARAANWLRADERDALIADAETDMRTQFLGDVLTHLYVKDALPRLVHSRWEGYGSRPGRHYDTSMVVAFDGDAPIVSRFRYSSGYHISSPYPLLSYAEKRKDRWELIPDEPVKIDELMIPRVLEFAKAESTEDTLPRIYCDEGVMILRAFGHVPWSRGYTPPDGPMEVAAKPRSWRKMVTEFFGDNFWVNLRSGEGLQLFKNGEWRHVNTWDSSNLPWDSSRPSDFLVLGDKITAK